jgi:FtsP/CotA-like multicopper oxidase with cupredoxin domain
MDKQIRFNIGYVIIAVLAVVLIRDAWVGVSQVQTIPYSEFQHHLKTGELEELELVNDTAWHHPIHLHGHVFQVIEGERKGTSGDTVLIDPRSRAGIAFVADNPGNWMLHCHVLEHQASGMMATIRVA